MTEKIDLHVILKIYLFSFVCMKYIYLDLIGNDLLENYVAISEVSETSKSSLKTFVSQL